MYHLYIAFCLTMITMSVESVVKIQAFNEKNHNIGIQIEASSGNLDSSSDLYFRGYLTIVNSNNSCSFIEKPSYKQFGEKIIPFFLYNISSHWVALIKDSKDCSTTKIALNAKKAGYDAIIIHNTDNSFDSSEIKDIKIASFFINHSDAQLLKHSAFSSNLCVHVLDERYNNTLVIILVIIAIILVIILVIFFVLRLALATYSFYKRNVNEFKDMRALIMPFISLVLLVLTILLRWPFSVYKDFYILSKYDLCK